MKEWLALTEYNWTFLVVGIFAFAEFFRWVFTFKDWFFKSLGVKTKGMIEKEELNNRLKQAEESIEEIKNASKKNVDMLISHEHKILEKFSGIRDEVVNELNILHDKMDEQKEENKKTDCALLRDRISSGMKYFSKNIGVDGKVHISLSDYENMNELFQEYFSKNGNGVFRKIYEGEFIHFVIDR